MCMHGIVIKYRQFQIRFLLDREQTESQIMSKKISILIQHIPEQPS